MELIAAVEEYLTYLAVDRARSAETVRAYHTDLIRGPVTFWARLARPLATTEALTRDAVRAWQRALGTRGLAMSSRARQLQSLRGFLRHARREGWIADDLGGAIDLPKIPSRLPRPLPTDAVRALLASFEGGGEAPLRDAALIHFLLSTGCRISEALAVDRSAVRPDGRLVVRGKGAKERMVHLTPAAVGAIRAYLAARHDREPALFLNYDRRSAAGGPRRLTAAGARHVVRRIRAQTGIEGLRSPHVLRHTTATELLTITGNVRLVQEVLGHANLNTMQGYTRVVDAARVAAYEALAARLEPAEDQGPLTARRTTT
ncbi:MAG TPA: tyrosine-type recombinase/integrase [Candidatus Dormibacteraeota bacterium]|nr:tyrosine-type recombinase/integrase [Candidatus Dormibacteraeota bacterium]